MNYMFSQIQFHISHEVAVWLSYQLASYIANYVYNNKNLIASYTNAVFYAIANHIAICQYLTITVMFYFLWKKP